jgi:hypothetical protein
MCYRALQTRRMRAAFTTVSGIAAVLGPSGASWPQRILSPISRPLPRDPRSAATAPSCPPGPVSPSPFHPPPLFPICGFPGKLKFPDDFPFRPPAIFMITPNGRFETNRRLCLSISDFHPETWVPTWSVSARQGFSWGNVHARVQLGSPLGR